MAVVTGGSAGIGLGAAKRFAAEGTLLISQLIVSDSHLMAYVDCSNPYSLFKPCHA